MTAMGQTSEKKVLIISAPSGAGKSTLVSYLMDSGLPLAFSVSATSRKPRGSEVDGREYYFLSEEEFRRKITMGEFVEWEEVYAGHLYGTLRSEIDRITAAGKIPLFDVDVKGGISLKRIFGDGALSLFVMPPSVEVLRERLIKRATDTPEKIAMRVEKASSEMMLADRFDTIVINDNLQDACRDISEKVNRFLGRR